MPVVPFTSADAVGTQPKSSPKSRRRSLQDLRDPPSDAFAQMAAAQMHAEGRLLPSNEAT